MLAAAASLRRCPSVAHLRPSPPLRSLVHGVLAYPPPGGSNSLILPPLPLLPVLPPPLSPPPLPLCILFTPPPPLNAIALLPSVSQLPDLAYSHCPPLQPQRSLHLFLADSIYFLQRRLAIRRRGTTTHDGDLHPVRLVCSGIFALYALFWFILSLFLFLVAFF